MHGGPPPTLIPTVFTWTGGGKDVYITGGFNNWKEKIPLNLSEKDFTLIQYLPPGTYQYKFIVDGKWVHAPDQPIQTGIVLIECKQQLIYGLQI
jgi:5'-AMP-activated protein kinase regulatory beta subunit